MRVRFQNLPLRSGELSEATAETEHQVQSRLLLDVVVGQGAAVFELLSSEDETLLVRRNSLFVLDLGLHVVDGVGGLDLKGDGLSSEGLHEDLHTTAESEDQMKSRLFLNVVVREGAAILELLTGEDKTLLIRRNSFFVLNLGLHVVDGVGGLDLKGDGLAGQSLDEDLHTTAETEHQVQS